MERTPEPLSVKLRRAIRARNPGMRAGQAMFNALEEWRPDLAQRVRGHVDLDCYYDDKKMKYLSAWLIRLGEK
jgi:hypothetical protein